MKRLPRKRYAQLVAQWNKGVDAWGEIYDIIKKHGGDDALSEWRGWPDNKLPYKMTGVYADLDSILELLAQHVEVDE